jgi:hypothetical protein
MNDPRPAIEPGVGLFLANEGREAAFVFNAAVLPAMRKNDLNRTAVRTVFNDAATLSEVCRFVQIAEVIVADLTDLNPSVMYALGLAHGLGRCPILVTQHQSAIPFNLHATRCLSYRTTTGSLFELRDELDRALRIFLLAARATAP